jgi:hypothetical protein
MIQICLLCKSIISVLKTTMFIKKYWKIIKSGFLYKFFCLRMNFIAYSTFNETNCCEKITADS